MKNLGLLSWLSRKKLTDEQVANIFVNTSFDTVEQGWPQVAAFLNAAPEFSTSPELDSEDYGKFLMIVVSANLGLIPKHFDPGVDRAIIQRCCAKFGFALGIPPDIRQKGQRLQGVHEGSQSTEQKHPHRHDEGGVLQVRRHCLPGAVFP